MRAIDVINEFPADRITHDSSVTWVGVLAEIINEGVWLSKSQTRMLRKLLETISIAESPPRHEVFVIATWINSCRS